MPITLPISAHEILRDRSSCTQSRRNSSTWSEVAAISGSLLSSSASVIDSQGGRETAFIRFFRWNTSW